MQVMKENATRTGPKWVRVALQSQDGKVTYASATTSAPSERWELRNATLSPLETDTNVTLNISFQVCAQPFPLYLMLSAEQSLMTDAVHLVR